MLNAPSATNGSPQHLGAFLGAFSLGLGLAEVAAPRWVARQAGIPASSANLVRLCGVREILTGIGVLTPGTRTGGLWARVAGDALDLALLGSSFGKSGANAERLGIASAAVLGVSALDLLGAMKTEGSDGHILPLLSREPAIARATVAINRPAGDLYRYWRDFRNMPRFMRMIRSVEILDDRRSHWTTKAIGGRSIEWTSEVSRDLPDEGISLRSVDPSDTEHSGSVTFSPLPAERGTSVSVEISSPRANALLEIFASKKLHSDLRRFKQLIEIGEILTTEGQPAGRGRGETWLDSLARA